MKQIIFLILIHTLLSGCTPTKFLEVNGLGISEAGGASAGTVMPEAKNKKSLLKMTQKKIDILLVIDNSISMYDDAIRLGEKMDGFLNQLSNSQIDWQMCLISTNGISQGESYSWVGSSAGKTLTKETAELKTVILDSIQYIFDETNNNGDERAIAQMHMHMMRVDNAPCYRPLSTFVPIIISDEDERSTGGIIFGTNDPEGPFNVSTGGIEDFEKPENYIAEFNYQFVNNLIQAHAIIVAQDDTACFDEQLEFSKPSYGTFYQLLAGLTGGSTTSICAQDYNVNLDEISSYVISLSQDLQFECEPTNITFSSTPANPNISFKVFRNMVSVTYPSDKDYEVSFYYSCK